MAGAARRRGGALKNAGARRDDFRAPVFFFRTSRPFFAIIAVKGFAAER
jgi:hypothetical protein